jgi:pimeloyl-ACP methyl ester carboxylesterase
MTEATIKTFSAARVEFVVLKKCGHFWHECPDAFFSSVRQFLGFLPE